MKVTAETKAIAQRAYDFIIVNPHRHEQRNWISDPRRDAFADSLLDRPELQHCGTTMCVAGTVDTLLNGCVTHKVEAHAREALGLSERESLSLFFCFDNDLALDMLGAIAQGDEDKFHALADTMEEK